MTTSVTQLIGALNAATAFVYASALMVAQLGALRVGADLASFGSVPWNPPQATLAAAPLGGWIAWLALWRWWRKRRMERPGSPKVEIMTAGVGAGIIALTVTTALAFVFIDLTTVLADGLAPGFVRRIVTLPVATLAFAFAGLGASPFAVLWCAPVIAVCGPINAAVSLWISRLAEHRDI